MILNSSIFDKNINLVFAVLIFLVVILLMLLLKNILRKYSKKHIMKVLFFLFLTILSFSMIISSVIFFYKTAMTKMLIPSCMGIVLLIVDAVVYVLFFDNKGEG